MTDGNDLEQSPAEEYRLIAGRFGDLVASVPDDHTWARPAPVEGWTARDVVRHLVEWFPPFLRDGAGVTLPAGPGVDIDPVATWSTFSDGVQALLDDETSAEIVLRNPHIAEVPLPLAVSRFFTADVFMHTWDLARATGQDETLDEDIARELYEGMLPMDEILRQSGQYGAAVPVPDDADWQTKLLGFIGRKV